MATSAKSDRTESLFAAVAELPSAERAAFLDRECAGDQALREQLDALLQAHERQGHFIDRPIAENPELAITSATDSDLTGTVIAGRYKLLEEIGEGGMGTVWVAEQTAPVRRKVALKLIKAGMDSKAVVARFEAERQALAMMDHPNIAKVLDGGLTDAGRPFFVMEYVKGVPITEYCDSVRLSVTERLNLFVQVCSAVQHAHQKGIIHRDLKPANVLVAPYDDQPVPKVIDFGLAKALYHRLTERTLHTAHETVIGTPLYMSPEQAQLNNLDVDTRSDIYSLGVLLYEMLTGTTPLEKVRFKEAAWDEIRRIIREEEPPRPSTRLSSTGTLPSLAACRQTDPFKLTQQVRGELDWIVMKALEKDRTRRYETANGLAKDVQRYLAGEAVEACPPTLGYRLRKFLIKHRAAAMTVTSVAVVLLAGIIVSTWMAVRAIRAERIASEKADEAQTALVGEAEQRKKAENASKDTQTALTILSSVLEQLNPYRRSTENPPTVQEALVKACEALDSMPDLTPTVRAGVRGVFGEMLMQLHLYQEAKAQLKLAYEELERAKGPDDLDAVKAMETYGNVLIEGRTSMKDLQNAERILTEVYDDRVRLLGAGHPDVLELVNGSLGRAIFYQGEFSRLEELCRKALRDALSNPDVGEQHQLTAGIQVRLANVLMRTEEESDLEEARNLCRRAIRTYETKLGPEDPSALRANMHLAVVEDKATGYAVTANRLHELTKRVRQACGTQYDRRVDRAYSWLSYASLRAGELSLADEYTKKLLDTTQHVLGERHPHMRMAYTCRAWYYTQAGEYEQAEAELKKVFSPMFEELSDLEGGWDDNQLTLSKALLAECLLHRPDRTNDDFISAEKYLQQAEKLSENLERDFGGSRRKDDVVKSHRLRQWVNLYTLWNKPDEAAVWQKKLDELNQK